MLKQQTLRDFVIERLSAAAEEIFALFERTIAEYEEELSRCKEESLSLRQQHRLDQALNPSVVLHKIPSPPLPPPSSPPLPHPGLKQEITEAAQIKVETEDHSIREEPFLIPEASGDNYLKNEELSMLLQLNTQHHNESQGEHIDSEPQIYSHSKGHKEQSSLDNGGGDDYDDDLDFPAGQMETEAYGDYNKQIQTIAAHEVNSGLCLRSGPGTFAGVNEGNMFGTGNSPKGTKKYQCPVCPKTFRRRGEVEVHFRVHTGERPFCCSICKKSFIQKVHLEVHMRTHSSEKPYSCSFCSKTFSQNGHLKVHLRTHTGERPFSCSVCHQTFTQQVNRKRHMLLHHS